VIWLWREFLIWIGIWVITPFTPGRLSRVDEKLSIFDDHFKITQMREIRYDKHELGDLGVVRKAVTMVPGISYTPLRRTDQESERVLCSLQSPSVLAARCLGAALEVAFADMPSKDYRGSTSHFESSTQLVSLLVIAECVPRQYLCVSVGII
jgi:hypothetical protein